MKHSIEELKRQKDNANSRRLDAAKKYNDACDRLNAALVEELEAEFSRAGITPGCKVRVFHSSYGGVELEQGVFGYAGCSSRYIKARPEFTRVKRDGTVGKAVAYVNFTRMELAD